MFAFRFSRSPLLHRYLEHLSARAFHRVLAVRFDFGRTKFQKLLYLAEMTYQLPLEGSYRREQAGPLDADMIYSLEDRARERDWFHTKQRFAGQKSGIEYTMGEASGAAYEWSLEVLVNHARQLDELIAVFGRCNRETAEKIATLYGAWNDLLLDGKPATDKAILDEVLQNWHPKKKEIPRPIWRHQLELMRRDGPVPIGRGTRTNK